MTFEGRRDYGFTHFADNIEDYAIILLDTNGVIVDWNKGAENIKGYDASEILGKSFTVFYSAEDRMAQVPDRILETALVQGRSKSEGWRVRKDGTRFWASVSITALHNEKGETENLVKITRDLSERKKNEELLMQKNQMLSDAERTARMCSWTWDIAADMFGWSEAACEIFHLLPGTSMNYTKFLRLVHADDQAMVHDAVEKMMYSGTLEEITFRILLSGNPEKYVVVCGGRSVKGEDGKLDRISGTLQDITEKMTYVNHIREKNKKLAEIARVQSHIVRSQVANILGICEVFDTDNLDSEENRILLSELRASTDKLDLVTRRIVSNTYESTGMPTLPGEWK